MKWLMRGLGVVWLLGGVAVFLIYLSSQNWDWDWETGWSTLAACATWVLAGGIFFVFWQIMEARRSTHAQVAVELFRELRDETILNTFREIYELKPDDIRRLLTSNEEKDVKLRHRVEGVLDRFELLGALVARGIINERLAIEAYGGPPVLKCWYQLGENYIKSVRRQRGLFCKYVEDFAKRTVKYQIKHAPEEEWIHFLKELPVKQPENRINLVANLRNELLSPCEQLWAMFIRYLWAICNWCLKPLRKLCEKICGWCLTGPLKVATSKKQAQNTN